MNGNLNMREIMVNQYLSNIDFTKNSWSYNKIREDLKGLLGEEPGIDIIYKKDVMINEVNGKAKEFDRVSKVSIVFSDLTDKFKKVEFIID
jgi:hypothetical protein